MEITLETLNTCDPATFVAVCGSLFEHSPWVMESIVACRPFADVDDLLNQARQALVEAGVEAQVKLIQAHPDLAGRLAEEGQLTADSTKEQQAAGLHELTAEQRQQFRDYNAAYLAKFGFPFVICARENKVQAILTAFPHRLQNDRQTEIETALREIMQIARHRLQARLGTSFVPESRTT